MFTPDGPVFTTGRSGQMDEGATESAHLNAPNGPVVHTGRSGAHIGRSRQEAHPVKTAMKLHTPDGSVVTPDSPVVYNGRISEPTVDSAAEKFTRTGPSGGVHRTVRCERRKSTVFSQRLVWRFELFIPPWPASTLWLETPELTQVLRHYLNPSKEPYTHICEPNRHKEHIRHIPA